ncbi:MAG: alpha/beta hydrolase [Oscillospiraceae bacterium]|nr:alpha/beta hydrolase [Oscillospiraceae bacterium]
MAYFNDRRHKIYYEESGSGPPLLLLHGNTASSAMFAGIVGQYTVDHTVIVMDFLGCGKSDRIQPWPEDLWYEEAMQAARLLDEKRYGPIGLIGASGGALAAINLALERPDLVARLIADSFEGERAGPALTNNLRMGRELSKQDPGARAFYEGMNGPDWESVVDADTQAVTAHAEHIGAFFHKPLSLLKPDILFTGSREDALFPPGFYENLFPSMLCKIGHGAQHLFEHGGHPAMLSNQAEFVSLSRRFLDE